MGQDDEVGARYAITPEDIKRLAEQKKYKEDQEREAALKAGAWDSGAGAKEYGFTDFMAFSVPFMWRGSCMVKVSTIGMFLILIISRFGNVIHPLVLKQVVANITCDPDSTVLEDGCPEPQVTYMLILLYAVTKFAAEFLNYIREIPFAYIAANAEKYIAALVYRHIQNQSLAFHLSRETGKIIRIVSKGSNSFAQVLRFSLFNILPVFVEIILVIGAIGYLYQPKFFWLNFGAMLLYLLVTLIATEWRAKFFKVMTQKDAAYVQKATDSLLNFETVKYFNAESHEQRRFQVALMEYKKANVVVAKSLVGLNMSQATIIALGLAGTLLLAYSEIKAGALDVSDFIVFNIYVIQLYFPLSFLGTFWRFIRQSWTDVELVLDILEVDQVIKEKEEPIEADIHSGEITFKNVSFSYDKDLPDNEKRQILYNLSFTVPAGKSVALVGATGSGKSTIMRLLYRFYEVDQGAIHVDGQDITNMKIDDLRSSIAIVPQDCVLFNDTVAYNIAYGGVKDKEWKALVDDPKRHDELIEKIKPSSQRAQIHDYIMLKSKGYEELVGERGLKLSGGEKQRVAIARALLKKSKIMCFDEATAALDTETERQVQLAIDDVAKDSTTLMIAHRLSTVRNCDKIIALKHGVIQEQGTHDELLAIPGGYYKELWEKQAESKEAERKEKEEITRLLAEQAEVYEQRRLKAAGTSKTEQ